MSANSHKSFAFFLTFFFPLVGLIYTITHWREAWAKNTFWLACIYMGAVLIFCPEGTVLGMGGDGGRYVIKLIEMHSYDSGQSIISVLSSYQKDHLVLDLYQPLLTYLVSRFTDNGHILFALFAFVFGFFYSRNIWYILERLPEGRLGYLFILVTLYFLICPITQINGVRMWTALQVYVYGMMPYLLERDRSKIWWVFITPLIHFSFIYVAALGLVWILIPFRVKVGHSAFLYTALVFFIVTFFINSVNVSAVGGVLAEYSPDSYEERLGSYINEEYIAARAEAKAQNNWYVALSGNITHWCYNLLLLAILPCLKRRFKNEDGLLHLFVFSLVLSGFANLMALVPSGGRFQLLSQMFKVPLIILVAMAVPLSDSFRKVVNISLVFLLLPFVFETRKLFDYFSITVLFGNFITVLFWENNVPLIDIIKRFI